MNNFQWTQPTSVDQALASSQREEPVAAAAGSKNGLGHSILSKAFGAPYQG